MKFKLLIVGLGLAAALAFGAAAVIGVILSLPATLVAARGLIAGTWVNQAMRIALDTIGFFGRFFANDMEGTDKGLAESQTATGLRRLDVVACATIPDALQAFISTSLYALEKAVGLSTILGLVGAGSIGIELKVWFDLFNHPTAMTVILMIAVMLIGLEQLSGWARTRIIGEQK